MEKPPVKSNEKGNDDNNKLFVGNLHYSVSEGDIITVFSKHGKVAHVQYFWHKFGPQYGQPKGNTIMVCDPEISLLSIVQSMH